MIKIEDWELIPEKGNQVAILAPKATINIIEDYQVTKKFKVVIPPSISAMMACPNPRCICNHETMHSFFYVLPKKPLLGLKCRYCLHVFSQDEINK